MGVRVDQLPDGEYAAVERCTISMHNGTHLDAPYHYFSSMNHRLKPGGEPSWWIGRQGQFVIAHGRPTKLADTKSWFSTPWPGSGPSQIHQWPPEGTWTFTSALE